MDRFLTLTQSTEAMERDQTIWSQSEQSQAETREVNDHLRRQDRAIMVIETNQVPAQKGRSRVEGNK